MCNCNKNKNKSSNVTTRITSGGGNCPNKRLQLNKIKSDTILKASQIFDENKKTMLNNVVLDIENYLADKTVCPRNEYITAIKNTINGIIN